MAIALFHFHHLLSPKKIVSIRTIARSLRVRGVYKCGYPGLLLVSTPPSDAAALIDLRRFVGAIKAMPWKSCSLVNGGIHKDAVIDFGDGKGVEEVQAIRDVVAASRAAGLERWVKAGLGLGKADEPEEKGS